MSLIKKFIKKYFEGFAFFYPYLKYRVFIVMFLSIIIGILDGLGLSMFLPLLQMVNESSGTDPESLGKLEFLVDFLQDAGVSLTVLSVLLIMLFFFVVKGIIQYITGMYKVNVQQWFIANLRKQSLRGMNNLKYKYFVTANSGRIQNTLTGEINKVATSYLNYFDTLQYGILVIVFMSFAFYVDFQFALLVTIGGALSNLLFKRIYKSTRRVSKKLTGEGHILQNLLIQNVTNYKYLRATGLIFRYDRKLQESVKKIEGRSKKIGQLDAIVTAVREPVLIGVVILVIYVQIALLNSELGPILLSLLFFYRALSYMMLMQIRYNKFLSVAGSLENIKVFQKELNNNKQEYGEVVLEESIHNLKLVNVSFNYGETEILKDISLDIGPNETIAFVGESGSGKTTLVNITAGLFTISQGKYLINDVDHRRIDFRSLQLKIGYITQDPVIFNDSIYNNICLWEERSPDNERKFWEVARQASIDDFIEELPDKEETILGNNGINLSGGQRQRISIARELYKSVELLILDEATSSLDSETEKAIQKNLEALKGNHITLIVAHRISTIKNVERIVVLKKGEIVGTGNFQTLMSTTPYFEKLVRLQNLEN